MPTATETQTLPLTPRDARLAPWRAFVTAQAHVSRRLDEDLRAEHGLSLQEYVALLILVEAPERRLRMGRLADALTLSKSGATRLIDRLVDDGLVARVTCSSDLRGAEAALTDAGVNRLRTAAPTHLRGIADYFLSAIDGDDLEMVERTMKSVADRACGSRGAADRPARGAADRPARDAADRPARDAADRPAGRLLVGTSGFSYPDWTPRFYPAGTRPADRLSFYASQLPALELNATFRRRPTASAIAGWLRATPPDFRFAVKAQRGSAFRALTGEPAESVAWLTEPLPAFGDRLGAVLFRVPAEVRRDGPWVSGDVAAADARLMALLEAWPRSIPLVVEFQDPSWHVDETFAAMRATGAVLCTTDLPPEGDEGAAGADSEPEPAAADPARGGFASGPEQPFIRRTGSFLYLRLRRHDYDAAGLDAWAARIEPFLAAGDDVFVFFRHDPVGRAAELALEFARRVGARA